MEISSFNWYIIIVNIVGFFLYVINMLLCRFTKDKKIDAILAVVSLLGGSLGIAICILVLDRKAEKSNMMSRVFVFCILVMQIIIWLVIQGYLADNITFAFWEFFKQHKIALIYLGLVNIVTFIAFGIDKIAAIRHKNRIKIIALLGLAFLGGSIGGLAGMYLFRHKTQKNYFSIGLPLIMIMQLFILFYAMNVK